MNVLRPLLILLCLTGVASCSLPGLKYQSGGSAVWEGKDGVPGDVVQISEITPALTAQLAAQTFAASSAQKSANNSGGTNLPPWIYKIGVGDILTVIVWDHPELTNPAGTTVNVDSSGRVVRPDGTIFYPYAGNIVVAGKTPADVREMLTQTLAKAIQSPQVDVKVLQYRSQFVNVVGDVEQPCRLPISDMPMTVIDAINACKTIRSSGSHRDVELERDGVRRSVDLYAIYKGRDPLLYQPLLGGDTLYVQDDRRNRVFVVGEVTKQAAVGIPVSGLTLADALSDALVGGLNQETADTKNIYVFRGGVSEAVVKNGVLEPASFRPQIFHLNVKSADALVLADQFQLEPRDVVFASSSAMVSYSRAASLVLPTISALLQTGVLVRATR